MKKIRQGQIWRNEKKQISIYIDEVSDADIIAVDEMDKDNMKAQAHSFSYDEFQSVIEKEQLQVVK